jgi:subtilisin family serine protease
MSTFTSWGPTNELDFSPRIAAPGGNIYSTFPLELGGYAVLQGTSMATPYITGVVALYLSVYGATDPLKVRNQLGTTGNSVDFNNGTTTTNNLRAPIAQQGGGLVNAFKFVKSVTEIAPAFIALNVYTMMNTSDG